MAIDAYPTKCLECGSPNFKAIGRAEAGEFNLTEDVEVYSCGDCWAEWDTTDVKAASGQR